MHHLSQGKLRSFFLGNRLRNLIMLMSVLTLMISSFFVSNAVTHAASYCRVTYTVTNQWQGGFGGGITIQNTSGSSWSNWSLGFTFPASGQSISQGWNGVFKQSGQNVTVTNASWNSTIAANGSVNPGFNGTWTGSNPVPTSFTVNGNTCNGGNGGPTPTSTIGTTPTPKATTGITPTPKPTIGITPTPTVGNGGGCNVAPVDPQATRQARNLLCYLYSVYGNHILSGQQESLSNGSPDYEMNYIHNVTGRYPAIRGLDMDDRPGSIDRAIAWWRAGGIPLIGWHVGAPTKSDDYTGSQQYVSINATLTPGTAEYQSFLSRLDSAASNLARAQAANVAILWRPFHEAGGTWFWWSKEGGSQYVRLWRFEFNYFTQVKKLHNLVWLLPYDGSPNSTFWPGKAYVDIAGADDYVSDHGPLTSLYNTTRGIAGSSIPIALHENGSIPDPDQLQSSGTKWVLFNTWNSQYLTSSTYNTQAFLRKVYTSPYVITRDRVPNLN